MAGGQRGADLGRIAIATGVGLAVLGGLNALAAYVATARKRRGATLVKLSDELQLRTLEAGSSGERVLLIHGNATTADDWALSGVLERLADSGKRVIAVDRPGCGLSTRPQGQLWTPDAQADAIADLMRVKRLGPALVVAHSIGVQTALSLALDHPERVIGLVLISGYYAPTPRGDIALAAPIAIPYLGDLLRHTISPVLGRIFNPLQLKAMFSPQGVPQAYVDETQPLAFRPSQLRATGADAAHMAPTAAAQFRRLKELKIPVTLIAGAKDKIVSPDGQARRAAKRIEDVEYVKLADVGHMAHFAAPEAIVDAVENTLERAAASLSERRHPIQPMLEGMTP